MSEGSGRPNRLPSCAREASIAISPEPLILFTAGLGDADPRLRDEATDWCVRYGRYVSAARRARREAVLRAVATVYRPPGHRIRRYAGEELPA